ncbi:GbsR/MarR family transcriptional regulator [Plantibacter sp. YIM 135249]|uniref:GbsR/MarR family transcriptional regulator n=1 Tax=Plantibacter sp. YIM 135249 TaxID=3423918 RepID=UPI003D33031F
MSEPDAVQRLTEDPIAQTVSALAANGFPRMPAAVLMLLMSSEESALTADQLAEELQASPAAVSGAVRYLVTIGLLTRHQLAGSRRYVYELPRHPWYTVSIGKTDLYTHIVGLSEQAAEQLGPNGRARLEEMAEFFRFLERRLPAVLDEWNELRSASATRSASGLGMDRSSG